MAIPIDQYLHQEVKDYIRDKYDSKKKVTSYFRKGSWQTSRYIQVSTCLKDSDIHYEYYNGEVQLHFEGKYAEDGFKDFKEYLVERTSESPKLKWKRWQGRNKGTCVLMRNIDSIVDLFQTFSDMINIFDPLINEFAGNHEDLFSSMHKTEHFIDRSYTIQEDVFGQLPQVEICSVGSLPFDAFVIPPYQRPYKWTAKNVNQLISDILAFRERKQYRLGTLVLHNDEIVDGQQRIITLALLIRIMYNALKDEKVKASYSGIDKKINAFSNSDKVSFSNRYTLHNVIENIHTIENRKADFDQQLFDFLLRKCEFVVVRLNSISEAFQFFDSQNARGKDLAAHDLLKAYHLREISVLSQEDSNNIDEWQNKPTSFLMEVFLTLFRAKRWSRGKWGRRFTKEHTDEFKGISLSDGKRYPFYQMEVIAHIFSSMYNQDPMRAIDRNHIEYPFNLDDQIINGGRFFDMIRHYMNLYEHIRQYRKTLPDGSRAKEILILITSYNGSRRTGDGYIRDMFYTLLLYYVDRFGEEELDKVTPLFFIWAYKLRLQLSAVQLASIDNYATAWDSMFRYVHDAKTPYDIININIEGVQSKQCSGCEQIKNLFKEYNKYYGND